MNGGQRQAAELVTVQEARRRGLDLRQGYVLRLEAPGAWRNGTRVVKTRYAEGDAHGVGAKGVVIGSIGPREMPERKYWYWVEWDGMPGVPVFVSGDRVAVLVGG